jgi:hypothetical protein
MNTGTQLHGFARASSSSSIKLGLSAAAATGLAGFVAFMGASASCDTDEEYEAAFAPGTGSFPPLAYGKWERNWDGRAPPAGASSQPWAVY